MLLNHADLLAHFNHTSTFRHASDLPLTLLHLDSVAKLTSETHLVPLAEKNALMATEGLAPVAYVQTNCDNPMKRDDLVEAMMQAGLKVDAMGPCLKNKDLPEGLSDPGRHKSEDFLRFLARYKFVIAVENAVCEDYVTEKVWRALEVGVVPIYFGAPNVREYLPNDKSAVFPSDFKSVAELVEFIKDLNVNDEKYREYLSHKPSYSKGRLVENENLLSAMKARPYRAEPGGMNFVEAFECLVCERVSQNLKVSRMGFKPVPYRVNKDHYGCPEPKSALETLYGQDTKDDAYAYEYKKSGMEARLLSELISKNEPFEPEYYASEQWNIMKSLAK